jgi:hypothetical protein
VSEVVLRRSGWIPRVERSDDGALRVALAAGANSNHDPREFSFPIEERHLDVMRDDLARHLLLWCAVLPLCDAAGTQGPLDEDAAVALLDPVLLGTAAEVDVLFRERKIITNMLVGHGADVPLLERGQVLESLHSPVEASNPQVVQAYVANRDRVRRGVTLSPVDEAVLRFTGQYLHSSTRPGRKSEAVDPGLLPEVERVIATAERAADGLVIRRDPRRGKHATDKHDWNRMTKAVESALRREHPRLTADTVRSVAFLMCSEAADRSRHTPEPDSEHPTGPAAKTALTFTDEDGGAEQEWSTGGPLGAGAAFWEFVAEHSRNQVFTVEDVEHGEGVQVHFYSDSAARITTVVPGRDGVNPQYRVEYALIDGMDGYRDLVSSFVGGGCAALEAHGPWMLDVDEFEAARRRRDAERTND